MDAMARLTWLFLSDYSTHQYGIHFIVEKSVLAKRFVMLAESLHSVFIYPAIIQLRLPDCRCCPLFLNVDMYCLCQRHSISCVLLCIVIAAIFAILFLVKSPYLGWDDRNPETVVLGVAFHALEWLFVRVAPIILICTIFGIFLTRKKR